MVFVLISQFYLKWCANSDGKFEPKFLLKSLDIELAVELIIYFARNLHSNNLFLTVKQPTYT